MCDCPEPIGSGDAGMLRFGEERKTPGWTFADGVRGLKVCGGKACPAWEDIGLRGGLCRAGIDGVLDCWGRSDDTIVYESQSVCPVAAVGDFEMQTQAIAWVQWQQREIERLQELLK